MKGVLAKIFKIFQKVSKKWFYLGMGVVVLGLAIVIGLFGFANPLTGSAKTEFDRYRGPSAKIYGETITDQQFNQHYATFQEMARQYPKLLTMADVRERTLRKCVSDFVFKREVEKAGNEIKVTAAEIDDLIKQKWPTKESLAKAIKESGKTSETEFRSWLLEQYRYRKFVILKSRELGVKYLKSQVDESMEKIKVSQILIATNDLTNNQVLRTDAAALKRVNEIYKKVTNGADFGAMAQLYSDDPATKDKGGTYGPYTTLDFKSIGFIKEFETAALALKEGEISKPLKTGLGYHIIKMDERIFPGSAEYEAHYQQAENDLIYGSALQADGPFIRWVSDLDGQALKNIVVLDPGLQAYRLLKTLKYEEAALEYEKALKRGYYRDKIEMYVDASECYRQLKQNDQALKVLERAPVKFHKTFEYLVAMAQKYQAEGQSEKAREILTKYSSLHPNDEPKQHIRLKELFTMWKMNDAVDTERKILKSQNVPDEEEASLYE